MRDDLLEYTPRGMMKWLVRGEDVPAGHYYEVVHSGHFFQTVVFLRGRMPLRFPCVLDFRGRLGMPVVIRDASQLRLAAEMHSAIWNAAMDRAEEDVASGARDIAGESFDELRSVLVDLDNLARESVSIAARIRHKLGDEKTTPDP